MPCWSFGRAIERLAARRSLRRALERGSGLESIRCGSSAGSSSSVDDPVLMEALLAVGVAMPFAVGAVGETADSGADCLISGVPAAGVPAAGVPATGVPAAGVLPGRVPGVSPRRKERCGDRYVVARRQRLKLFVNCDLSLARSFAQASTLTPEFLVRALKNDELKSRPMSRPTVRENCSNSSPWPTVL